MENWKPVVGYEGLYSVSDLGRIRSEARDKGRCRSQKIMHQYVNKRGRGYFITSLYKDRKHHIVKIHHLVAKAFIGPTPEGYEVNHKNTDTFNNCADNLEYITHKENIGHALKFNLLKCAKLSEKDVIGIRESYSIKKEPFKAIGDRFNVHSQTIANIIHRKCWKHI